MKKSIYSITLLDDLVREIDKRAYLSGTTRSGLINKLLAESLGLSTPESHRRSFISEMARLMSGDETFLINETGSSLFAVKSSISFKYNPTVRYSVAIFPEAGEFFGELRVSLRTQNPLLLSELSRFFSIWQQLEDGIFSRRLSISDSGKLTRRLLTPRGKPSPDRLADAVSSYIRLINGAISIYFDCTPDITTATKRITSLYRDYLAENPEII